MLMARCQVVDEGTDLLGDDPPVSEALSGPAGAHLRQRDRAQESR